MADQRKVGHAIRRRQGNAASHMGQATSGMWTTARLPGVGQAESTAGAEEGIVARGGVQQGRLKGVPDVYETGTASTGRRTSARNLVSDSTAFVSGVSAGRESEAHPSRPAMGQGEAAGARLTISPSMKIPTESPVPTQGAGYVVPSERGRSAAFGEGASEVRSR